MGIDAFRIEWGEQPYTEKNSFGNALALGMWKLAASYAEVKAFVAQCCPKHSIIRRADMAEFQAYQLQQNNFFNIQANYPR